MPKTKVEVYDKDQLIYPYIESDHVTFSNGMKVSEMLDQSISMPTVIHEDLSFKVGVGDQDVSSAIVDSSVAKMTIKGKTYQNILPEPSTHVLTNNKEMFKVNEGLDPNVEIVDGVSKSAILSGQTLVNLASEKNTSIGGDANITCVLPYKVDKITVYFLDPTYSKFQYFEYDSDGTYIQARTLVIPSDRVMFISLNSTTIGKVGYYNPNDINTSKNIVVMYGDTRDIKITKYFEGMQSVKMPVLTTTGKNLFDGKLEKGYINNIGDYVTNANAVRSINYIHVTPNTKYTIISNDYTGVIYIHEYDINHNHINQAKLKKEFTTSSNTYYVKFNTDATIISDTSTKFQLEQGTQATTYEPYKSNILSCQLAPLNQSMFEQGTFAESTPPNTQTYEQIKLDPNHLYDTRIRTKGTYKVAQGATYEVQLNDGYGIFVCFCKNGLYSATINRWLNGTRTTFTVPNDCDEMFFALRKTDNSAITPSDYSRIGLKIHQEVVLRSLPNGVCDTLNLNIGEYVQRIKEVVFDGSSDESIGMVNVNDTTLVRFNINNVAGVQTGNTNKVLCSSLPYLYIHGLSGGSATVSQECISNHSQDANTINIVIKRSRLSSVDVAGFRAYLQSNPITIQYSITTPIVKTVNLSSSGNWEKVIYNGTESWNMHETWSGGELLAMHTSCRGKLVGGVAFSDKFDGMKFSEASSNSVAIKECIRYDASSATIYVFIKKSRLQESSIDGFKQWLKDNGLTVWYQTETHLGSTQVKQPIFFKDGHIIQSSGADNSLIPTLDYQAKTSNSYVMDLMKTGTTYTIKASSISGTATIGNAGAFTLNTNRTIVSPSSSLMDNKLLVIKGSATDLMILEGDVTSKTIPYFKGIKSAFEGEDKIEVLSTGRNLCPPQPEVEGHYVRYQNGTYAQNDSFNVSKPIRVIEGHRYRLINTNFNHAYYDKNMNYITTKFGNGIDMDFYSIAPKNAVYLRVSMMKGLEVVVNTDGTKGEYRESNSTKIPILSPLRSLPNGVCDEIILDREKNKATLIQRVGHTILGQNDGWGSYDNVGDTMKVGRSVLPHVKNRGEGMSTLIPYTFNSVSQPNEGVYIYRHASSSEVRVRLKLKRTGRHDAVGMQNWLRSNNIVTLYELETPIITEIDLEGFPYIYKDGHIFLNGETVPVTEITYSINQCQQISASNEDIIRHEKELTYLQKLIAQYVQVDYESVLLSLKV